MGKMKRNLMILAVLAVVAAFFYPTIKKHYKTYFKPHVELTQGAVSGFLRMQVAGYYPYKFVLPLLAVFVVYKIIKKRREKKRLEEERKRLEALGGEDGKKATPPPPPKNVEVEPKKPVEPTPPPPSAPTPAPVPVPAPDAAPPADNNNKVQDLDNMDIVGNRVRTFTKNWSTTTTVNPFDLARCGFVYTGREDTVECLKCKGTLMEWKKEDHPLQAHLEYYPECLLARQLLESGHLEDAPPAEERMDDIMSALLVCEALLKRIKDKELSLKEKNRAQHQLISLKNRLDTTERTMHLVMKQMEAISKCLAKTVADDPSLLEGPHMAQISETLKTMKA